MSKQLKPNQWLELFNTYETLGTQALWYKYVGYRKINKNSKYLFFKKYKKFLYHNRDMNTLISMTGKASKKGTKSGRPKNSKDKLDILKKLVNNLGPEEVAKIFKELLDKGDDDLIEIIKHLPKDKTKLSARETGIVMEVSKSTVCNLWKQKQKITNDHESHKDKLLRIIYEILIKYKFRIGRKLVAFYIEKEYGIKLSARHLGRIMSKNGLSCEIRRAKRTRERKDTTANIPDLVLRDYDNKNHKQTIRASDVSYIPGTYDALNNFVYLSVVINHRTKEIEGWQLSKHNDAQLIIESFDALKDNLMDSIVHTDHGADYLSKAYQEMLRKYHAIQSMSRVGNSLDNRVVEFWFSILKTELISKLDTKKMSFEELKQAIADYIDYYNNVRVQEKLGWMTPTQYKNQL